MFGTHFVIVIGMRIISFFLFLVLLFVAQMGEVSREFPELSQCQKIDSFYQSAKDQHISTLFPESQKTGDRNLALINNILYSFDRFKIILLDSEVKALQQSFVAKNKQSICSSYKDIQRVFTNALKRQTQYVQWSLTPMKNKDLVEKMAELKSIYKDDNKWLNEWPKSKNEIQDKFFYYIYRISADLRTYMDNEADVFKVAFRVYFREFAAKKKKFLRGNLVLEAMISSLDSHSAYYSEYEFDELLRSLRSSFVGVGIIVSEVVEGYKIIDIIQGGPAHQQNAFMKGDIITHVSGIHVAGVSDEALHSYLTGPEGSVVDLTLDRFKDVISTQVQRGAVSMHQNDFAAQIIRDQFSETLGYIELKSFVSDPGGLQGTAQKVFDALDSFRKARVQGVVLDLRGNGGGVLSEVIDVAGLFLDSANIVFEIGTQENNIISYRDSDNINFFKKPLVVLVDKFSASASEILAGSLKSYGRAIIVSEDSQTYGKGTIQRFGDTKTLLGITENSGVKLTTGFYFLPNGESPQFDGVKPDLTIHLPVDSSSVKVNTRKSYLEKDQKNALLKPKKLIHKSIDERQLWREEVDQKQLLEVLSVNAKARELIPFKSTFTHPKLSDDAVLQESLYVLEDIISYDSRFKIARNMTPISIPKQSEAKNK